MDGELLLTKGTIMRGLGFFGSLKFWLAAALILICQPALAEKRVALVLGNSAYQNVPPLSNPVNDAALMAKTLTSEPSNSRRSASSSSSGTLPSDSSLATYSTPWWAGWRWAATPRSSAPVANWAVTRISSRVFCRAVPSDSHSTVPTASAISPPNPAAR